MTNKNIRIKSISQFNSLSGLQSPKHPLISLVDYSKIKTEKNQVGNSYFFDIYIISLKDRSCGADYGRNTLDFDNGVILFSAPGHKYTVTREFKQGDIQGWMLLFHPDLISGTNLGELIDTYTFFDYDVFEALHLSEDEEKIIDDCACNIQREYEQAADNHSKRVIVSNLELLLNYSVRFYERQFNTRLKHNLDYVSRFEKDLKNYFNTKQHLKQGLPSIQYFSENAHLSKHYFCDLIKKETGKSPKDHINDFVIEKAKNLLIGTGKAINEIAYDLGFNYPHYFTRLFKSRTGHTPLEYRNTSFSK